MTTVWIDATAGIAGDMVLGALLDAGASTDAVQAAVDAVVPGAIAISTETVDRAGLRATHARVTQVGDRETSRTWVAIRDLISSADLAEQTKDSALRVFRRLAEAEARVHGTDVEHIHFHEVGGLDAIADVVGVCEALRLLGANRIAGSWIALGNGRIRAAHGLMPVPAPAVSELIRGWQVRPLPGQPHDVNAGHSHTHEYGHAHPHGHGQEHSHDHEHLHEHGHLHSHTHEHPHSHDLSANEAHGHEEAPSAPADNRDVGELATPTGVAILRALADSCEGMPAGSPTAVGMGAGGRDLPGWANVVRAFIFDEQAGIPSEPASGAALPSSGASGAPGASGSGDGTPGAIRVLSANLDDLDPRVLPGVIDALLAAGAVDAYVTPIIMKKGRPAFMVSALAAGDSEASVADVFLTHTTTLGVRSVPAGRTILERTFIPLQLDLGGEGYQIMAKVGHRGGTVLHAQAEWSTVADAAAQSGVPENVVAHFASAAIVQAGLVAGAELGH